MSLVSIRKFHVLSLIWSHFFTHCRSSYKLFQFYCQWSLFLWFILTCFEGSEFSVSMTTQLDLDAERRREITMEKRWQFDNDIWSSGSRPSSQCSHVWKCRFSDNHFSPTILRQLEQIEICLEVNCLQVTDFLGKKCWRSSSWNWDSEKDRDGNKCQPMRQDNEKQLKQKKRRKDKEERQTRHKDMH